MSTFLFNEIIFGPVKSRRLGTSLGINLLPTKRKYCNFNCVYCECGANINIGKIVLPSFSEFSMALENKLSEMKSNNSELNSITFAGNGEPTIHPDFSKIIDFTIQSRNNFFPNAKVSVLSNATMINKPEIVDALKKVDMNILKLDSAIEHTVININRPFGQYSVENTVNLLKQFSGDFILQTMFLEGTVNKVHFNNMTDKELSAWLKIVETLRPKQVMIYTIARDTPEKDLRKASHDELENIKIKIEKLGINVQVSE
ncbi:MAG: radical SAM protein [Bacteroidales bacterium]|nr:radical SAM protein [Bacteroidales bacterium]